MSSVGSRRPSALLLVAAATAVTGPVAAQDAARSARGSRVAAAVSPDTVRVGEPFRVGIRVRVVSGVAVSFPGSLAEGEEVLEPLGPPEIRAPGETAGDWQATYPMVAWRAGEIALPTAGLRVGGERVAVGLPGVVVASVLPAGTEELELRGPRPPLPVLAFPWGWLLAALAALLLLAWWLRRRRPGAVPVRSADPAEMALRALAGLRAQLQGGRLGVREGCDRLEEILRSYLEATRGWPAGALLPPRGNGSGPAAGDAVTPPETPLRRSALVRFARLRVEPGLVAEDAGALAAWVRSDAGKVVGQVESDAEGISGAAGVGTTAAGRGSEAVPRGEEPA